MLNNINLKRIKKFVPIKIVENIEKRKNPILITLVYENSTPLCDTFRFKQQAEQVNVYNFLSSENKFLGEFTFRQNGKVGKIDTFKINENIRGKKTSANIILSMLDFLITEANKRKLDILNFTADKNNPFNVVKLYSRIKQKVLKIDKNKNIVEFIIPLSEEAHKKGLNVFDDLNETSPLALLEKELEVPNIFSADSFKSIY